MTRSGLRFQILKRFLKRNQRRWKAMERIAVKKTSDLIGRLFFNPK